MQNKIDLLRIFNVVSECSTFREASTRLGISPQSVTRAIKNLEQELGRPLFHRTTRDTRITDFGKNLAIKSEAVIHEFDSFFKVKPN